MATLFSWSGGTLPAGIEGDVTYEAGVGHPSPGSLALAQQSGGRANAFWTFTATPTAALRFYFRTPATWPSSAPGIAMLIGLNSLMQITLGGAGQPGQLRLSRGNGTTVIQSSSGVITTSTWYRIEGQLDVPNSRARVACFPVESTTPVWSSGWQTHADFSASNVQKVVVGRPNTTPTLALCHADTILATDSVADWIGPDPDDAPAPSEPALYVTQGGLAVSAAIVGAVYGGTLVPASL